MRNLPKHTSQLKQNDEVEQSLPSNSDRLQRYARGFAILAQHFAFAFIACHFLKLCCFDSEERAKNLREQLEILGAPFTP